MFTKKNSHQVVEKLVSKKFLSAKHLLVNIIRENKYQYKILRFLIQDITDQIKLTINDKAVKLSAAVTKKKSLDFLMFIK